MLRSTLRPAVVLFVAMTLITGFLYPLVVTGIGKAVFPAQAAGSLITSDSKVIGSTLIGQNFADAKYFWGRPSATGPMPYNAAASSGSNQGPLNPALIDAVKSRVEALRAADPENQQPVPIDLVTASGSGLDPHISVAAANYQIARVAKARDWSSEAVKTLVAAHTQNRVLGFLGEARVNVLQLNLALDAQTRTK
jgi:K+-transporting ATPase ATPase C chain